MPHNAFASSDRRRHAQLVDGANRRDGTLVSEGPTFKVKPSIPAALPDGTIPVAALEHDLVILAPEPTEEGFKPFPGDLFTVAIDNNLIAASAAAYPEEGANPMRLLVPKGVMDTYPDGNYHVTFRVTALGSGDYGTSEDIEMTIDRSPAGGRLLPRIIFDETIERFGISLSHLLSLPAGQLVGTVPDYRDQAPGDELVLMLRARSNDQSVEIRRVDPNDGPVATQVTFTESDLNAVDADGVVEFFYYVANRGGALSSPSPSTALRLWIANSPIEVLAPRVDGANDGLITDADARPRLTVHIPAPTPKMNVGDSVSLRVGALNFAPIELSADDVVSDPMLSVDIAYPDLWRLVDDPANPAFSAGVEYDLIHRDVRSTSTTSETPFDLTLPGGRDPDHETAEHETFNAPTLVTASGAENVVNLEDSLKSVVIVVPSATPQPGHVAPFAKGDVIQAHLNDVPFGLPSKVDDVTLPFQLDATSSEVQAHPGTSILTYRVTRALSDPAHQATAISASRTVVIHAAAHLPGGEDGLQECVLPAAKRRADATGFYGLRPQDFLDTNSTPIRIYSYRNMAVGDTIIVSYEGFDAYDGGASVPGGSGTFHHTVTPDDLNLRDDVFDAPKTKAVFIDVPLPRNVAATIFRGRMEVQYEVSNEAGTATSDLHTVIVDVRMSPTP